MAKDRFNTRNSYDPKFKFNEYVKPVKTERMVSSKQIEIMKQMYISPRLSVWEKGFIKNCLRYNTLSDKQKFTLNSLFHKFKRCGNITI